MATHYDPLGGYYATSDKDDAEDAALVRETFAVMDSWYKWTVLRPHFTRASVLTADQRSRLAYWDDLINRI